MKFNSCVSIVALIATTWGFLYWGLGKIDFAALSSNCDKNDVIMWANDNWKCVVMPNCTRGLAYNAGEFSCLSFTTGEVIVTEDSDVCAGAGDDECVVYALINNACFAGMPKIEGTPCEGGTCISGVCTS